MSDKKNIILYLGDDTLYYENLKKRYHKYFSSIPFDHIFLYTKNVEDIQSLILKIIELNPDIIFIDLAKHFEDYLHLGRLLTRVNSTKSITTIGLLDQNQNEKQVKESYLSGLLICHVKSSELHDVVFDSIAITYPDKAPEHAFVKAQLNDYLNVFELAKIGFITQNSIHLECNRPIASGSQINLNQHWFQQKIISTQRFIVTKMNSDSLFYNYKYGLDLDFTFIDPYVANEGDDEQYIYQKQLEDEEKIDEAMAKLDEWLEDNFDASFPKITKVLIIDRELKLYGEKEKTDNFSFIIRCQPYLEDPGNELKRLGPQIIFFEIFKNSEDQQGPENTFDHLKEMIKAVSNISNYEPYFVVLNTKKEMSQKLRTDFNYNNILCHESKINKEIVVQMAKLLEPKINAKYKLDDETAAVYLKKTNPISIAELVFPITLTSLSETDLLFTSEVPFNPFTTFRLEIPANFYVTVIPKGKLENNQYYGLIHGISENEKKKLRKFINSVFFREKDEIKRQEKVELEEKKNKLLEEKQKLSEAPEENPNDEENED